MTGATSTRVRPPAILCPLCRPGRLLGLVPSGPSGLRYRCTRCRLVLVMPRAQLAAVARRLTARERHAAGWPE